MNSGDCAKKKLSNRKIKCEREKNYQEKFVSQKENSWIMICYKLNIQMNESKCFDIGKLDIVTSVCDCKNLDGKLVAFSENPLYLTNEVVLWKSIKFSVRTVGV